jgi:hypothetical protein
VRAASNRTLKSGEVLLPVLAESMISDYREVDRKDAVWQSNWG